MFVCIAQASAASLGRLQKNLNKQKNLATFQSPNQQRHVFLLIILQHPAASRSIPQHPAASRSIRKTVKMLFKRIN